MTPGTVGQGRRWWRGSGGTLIGAALLVGAITLAARAAGFVRWLVFARTVGPGCLGDAYTTANQLPNVAFELAAGGMLAATVVPLVAGPMARGDLDRVRRSAAALLGWLLVLLVPLSVLTAVLSAPYARLMIPDRPDCPAATVDTASGLLVWFAPQVVLYGLAVWASALLNAQHRFAAAASGPLLSTLVVAASYVAYGASGQVWVLGAGTTAGVLALALTVLVPLGRSRIARRAQVPGSGSIVALRPTLRFPPGDGSIARRLTAASLAALAAQQLATTLLTYVGNRYGDAGTIALYSWANAIYLVPFAVLAAPIATTMFPRFAESGGASPATVAGAPRAASEFGRRVSGALRAALLAGCAGTALLVATGPTVSLLFAPQGPDHSRLASAVTVLGLALPGYAVLVLAGRALVARHRAAASAGMNTLAWVLVIVLAVVLGREWPGDRTVISLGWAVVAGMTAGGLVGAIALRRDGWDRGLLRSLGSGVVAAALAGLGGRLLADRLPEPRAAISVVLVLLFVGAAVVLVLAGVVRLLDAPGLRGLRSALSVERRPVRVDEDVAG
jgi:putative peptidoglycan lipid II flippase